VINGPFKTLLAINFPKITKLLRCIRNVLFDVNMQILQPLVLSLYYGSMGVRPYCRVPYICIPSQIATSSRSMSASKSVPHQSVIELHPESVKTSISPMSAISFRRTSIHLLNVERSNMRKLLAIFVTITLFTNKRLRTAQRLGASLVALSRHIEIASPDTAGSSSIKYGDIINIRNPNPDRRRPICDPRTDVIEKAKDRIGEDKFTIGPVEFLGTTEEPKWYFILFYCQGINWVEYFIALRQFAYLKCCSAAIKRRQ
jgi:hypothetical protein